MGVSSFFAELPARIQGGSRADSSAGDRSIYFPSVPQMLGQFPFGLSFSQSKTEEEQVMPTFAGYATGLYYASPIIFSIVQARASLFSEARFQWRSRRNGRPGPLFGNAELARIEEPWPNGTTGDLIVRLEQDYSLSGNFYGWRNPAGLARMRPDWVTIVLGSNMLVDDPADALDAEVIGYIYHPGGKTSGNPVVPLNVNEVCHFTGTTPDPTSRFIGTSWLTSIIADVQADNASTTQKQKYFESGGPNIAISVDIPDVQEFNEWVQAFKDKTEGAANAYSRLFFNTGVPNVSTIGSTMVDADFTSVAEASVLRMAAPGGVPAIILGFEPATFANYGLAMRRFADLTARPMWRMMAACFQSVLTAPSGAELWYDDRDIPALKDDIAAVAETQAKTAAAAKLYADGGWEPDSIIDALDSNDMSRLTHSGLPTVQLQKPGGNGQLPAAPAQPQLPAPARAVIEEFEEVLSP